MLVVWSSSGIWIDVKMETNFYGYPYGNFLSSILSNYYDNSSSWYCINNCSMYYALFSLWQTTIILSKNSVALVDYVSLILPCGNIWKQQSRFKLVKSRFKYNIEWFKDNFNNYVKLFKTILLILATINRVILL